MNWKLFAISAIALTLGTSGLTTARAAGSPSGAPTPAAGQQHGGWDAPPREFRDFERSGYADGIAGAHHDMDNHRSPDVNNRDEYRSPRVAPEMREAYRNAFRRGYEAAMAHPYTPAAPSFVQAVERAWDAPPPEFREMQSRGYREGIQGAHRDFDNNRQPDVYNRDEYHHPVGVPVELQPDYREGFRRGYEAGWAHLMNGQPQPPVRAWDAPPPEFREMQSRGYRDGIEGAHRDFDNNRRPSVYNRDEFRNPVGIPIGLQPEYRVGFQRGYEAGWAHLTGIPGR